jgi:hypothetical protein
LEPGREVGRLPQGQLLVAPPAPHRAHGHRPRMDADADGEPQAVGLYQTSVQCLHGVQDAQAGAHGAPDVILMGLRIAKVHQQAIAEILRDMPVKALDDLDTAGLISQHDLAEVFWVELTSEAGGVCQVTEQHRELTAFGFGRTRCGAWRGTLRRVVWLSDGRRSWRHKLGSLWGGRR